MIVTLPTGQARLNVQAFCALLGRDLRVLRKTLKEVLPRTVLQPFMLVFVFAYVFPKIGQGVGGTGRAAESFSSLLVAGVVALSVVFQGIQAVALPLVTEFGFTREIDDRVMAPLPVSLVAVEKIVSGAIQSLLSGLVVFPIAAVVPATPVHLDVNWPVLVTIAPLAGAMSGALGLFFGTVFEPRTVPVMFGVVILPLTFLGAVYYPWMGLTPIPWLKWLVLVNPLVYLSEGFRAALVGDIPHMPLAAVYTAVVGFLAVLAVLGIRGFTRRVLA